MNKLFISLLGALALIGTSGQASLTNEMYNRLDNDVNYQNLSAQEQDVFDDILENSLSNLEEKGVNLTEANSQMFLIDTIKALLSKSKEDKDMSKKMPEPAEAVNNGLNSSLDLNEANANYGETWDAIKAAASAIKDAGKAVIGKVADVVASGAGKLGDLVKPKPGTTTTVTVETPAAE